MPDQINQQIGCDKPDNQNDGDDGWYARRYPSAMDTLGARLKHAREAAGLTQAELAERVGMAGQSSIEAIEAGRSKRPTRINEIAKACGVTVEWLQGRPEGAELKRRSVPEMARKAREIGGLPDLEAEQGSYLQVAGILSETRAHVITGTGSKHENELPEVILNNPPFSIKEIDIKGGASYGGGKPDEEWQDGDYATDKPVGL